MALLHRKVVRDAIRACLDGGFNASLNALSAAYGVPPFAIDFSDASTNFLMGRVRPEDLDLSRLTEERGLTIYTEDLQGNLLDRRPHNVRFAGAMVGGIDFFIRTYDGMEPFDSEGPLEMVEDAVLELLNAYRWPISAAASVSYQRGELCSRDRDIPLADGYAQKLTIQAQFLVSVT
jgi:hypothetical protein